MSAARLIALVGLALILGLSVVMVSVPSASAASPKIDYKIIVSFHNNNPDPANFEVPQEHIFAITFYSDGTYSGVGELSFHSYGPAGAQVFPVATEPPWGFVFFKVQNNGTWTIDSGVFILLTETDTLIGNGFQLFGLTDYLHGPPASIFFPDPVPFMPVLPAGHYSDQIRPGFFQQTEVIVVD